MVSCRQVVSAVGLFEKRVSAEQNIAYPVADGAFGVAGRFDNFDGDAAEVIKTFRNGLITFRPIKRHCENIGKATFGAFKHIGVTF